MRLALMTIIALLLSMALLQPRAAPAQTVTAGQAEPPLQDDENCEDDPEDLDAATSRAIPPRPEEIPPRSLRDRLSQPLTPAFAERILEVAGDIDPAKAKLLRTLQGRHPRAFDRLMRQQSNRRFIAMAELKERDPKLYEFKLHELKVDADVSRAAKRLREARRTGSAEQESLEQELQQHVIKQVAFSIKARLEYMIRLKQHVEALEEAIDKDAMNFFDTVHARIQHLMREDHPAYARDLGTEGAIGDK